MKEMNRESFGSYLKDARAARSMALAEVSRITKIPERSLEALESGKTEGLPAEVFVRGFVGSYAKVVGLNAAEVLARYGEAVRAEPPAQPKLTSLASRLAPGLTASAQAARERRAALARAGAESPEAAPEVLAVPEARAPKKRRSEAREDEEAGPGRYRVGLTFAVIVLVIIATLTLSFLLRRPSQEGDDPASPVSSLH